MKAETIFQNKCRPSTLRGVLFSLLFISFICSPTVIFAYQENPPVQKSIFSNNPGKPLQDSIVIKKRFGKSVKQLMLSELVPWSFDRYVANAQFSHISFQTISHNLSFNSWTWDDDDFPTNQFGHPYHGSVFFNAFRNNGYSFWQSVPAAFAGSYIWETFAENQAPSFNDFINSGFGGFIFGEATHRLSSMIIDNKSRGFKRQASEVLVFLINPIYGLNRILDRKWGKVTPNSTERDSSQINTELDIGLRKFNVNDRNVFTDGHFGVYGRMKLLYGTPAEKYKKPFSNFFIVTEFGEDDSSKINVVSVYGSLTGWKINSGRAQHLAILSANYDFIHNEAFFYSGQSIKMNVYSEFKFSGKTKLNTSVGAGPIILAAVPDDYLYRGRNYDYGPGASYNAGCKMSISDKVFYSINYKGSWMTTRNGNPSDYYLNTLTTELSCRIIKKLSLSTELGYFNLRGNYKNFSDVNKTYPYLRLSARFTSIF